MADARTAVGAHGGVSFSSEEHARQVFADLFGMTETRSFELDEALCEALFGRPRHIKVLVFDAGLFPVEVFVDPAGAPRDKDYDHLCVEVGEREAVIAEAVALGLRIRRGKKGDKEIVFLTDRDGNQYELKQSG